MTSTPYRVSDPAAFDGPEAGMGFHYGKDANGELYLVSGQRVALKISDLKLMEIPLPITEEWISSLPEINLSIVEKT